MTSALDKQLLAEVVSSFKTLHALAEIIAHGGITHTSHQEGQRATHLRASACEGPAPDVTIDMDALRDLRRRLEDGQ